MFKSIKNSFGESKKYIILLICVLLFWLINDTNATSWKTNSSWCHNSQSEWYHCHNSWYSSSDYRSSYSSVHYESSRELSDDEITEQIEKWVSCFSIWWDKEDKQRCVKLKRKYLDNKKKEDRKAEIKKKEEKEEKERQDKIKIYKEKKQKAIQSKIDKINSKIESIHKKNPKITKKILKKIKTIKQKSKEWSESYILLTWVENKILELLDYKIQYEVIKIIDWDTIKVKINNKETNLRLIWIDTPENSTARFWYKEKLWDEAKEKLMEIIWGNQVTLEYDNSQWKTDKYWRHLVYVFVLDMNINKEMIDLWYAKEYTYNKPYKYQKEFKKAENTAKENKLNIWSEEEFKEEWIDTKTQSTETYNNYRTYRHYYIWSRWWCYYYNSSWNKSYVSRSLCR